MARGPCGARDQARRLPRTRPVSPFPRDGRPGGARPYDDALMEEVAEGAGTSRALLYRHFCVGAVLGALRPLLAEDRGPARPGKESSAGMSRIVSRLRPRGERGQNGRAAPDRGDLPWPSTCC
ncbi:helix-turn-helix domain-containing protein [Streptomyces sp. NPDC056387]|uniref:helix-turn-helix domain-containing protein n=1 Tax=Streptomyces sp. NPDC056387 TaxID=3345803 RepID=UPI0035DB9896